MDRPGGGAATGGRAKLPDHSDGQDAALNGPDAQAPNCGQTSASGTPELAGVSAQAVRIYHERLKSQLEPHQIGAVVAIHPTTGDFAVGKTSPDARRALRERRPQGMIVTLSIGPDR